MPRAAPSPGPPPLIGVDLGGTKIEAVLARRETAGAPGIEALARRRVPTGRDRGYEAVLETAASLIEELVREARPGPRSSGQGPGQGPGPDGAPVPVGVGMPGGVTRGGLVKNSNTTCLNGRPFRRDLERRLGRGVRIRFENDANCFALAEARLGAGAPFREGLVFGVILGTGVGGGIVAGGRLWAGAQGIAGEWGHHAVFAGAGGAGGAGAGRPCYCGQRGCLEAYVSGPAVAADDEARAGPVLALPEIAARRRAADPHAAAAIETFLDAFGRGLANVIDVLDPSAVVLGGGISNLDILYTEGVARVARYVFNDELRTPILRHGLGDSAGVLGAALLWDGEQEAPSPRPSSAGRGRRAAR